MQKKGGRGKTVHRRGVNGFHLIWWDLFLSSPFPLPQHPLFPYWSWRRADKQAQYARTENTAILYLFLSVCFFDLFLIILDRLKFYDILWYILCIWRALCPHNTFACLFFFFTCPGKYSSTISFSNTKNIYITHSGFKSGSFTGKGTHNAKKKALTIYMDNVKMEDIFLNDN